MPSRIDDLLERMTVLEREFEEEMERARHRWRYEIVKRRVRFGHDVRAIHRRVRESIPRFLRQSSVGSLLSAPLIYSMVVPIGLLDLWITLYQVVCFRL